MKSVKIGVVLKKNVPGGHIMDPIFAKTLSGHPIDLLNKIIRFEISTFKTVAVIAFTDAKSPTGGSL